MFVKTMTVISFKYLSAVADDDEKCDYVKKKIIKFFY
jgi:hypothetical protein